MKKDYVLARPVMSNPDLARIINSNEVQSALRPAKEPEARAVKRRNPLRNHAAMCLLNPAHSVLKRQRRWVEKEGTTMNKRIQKKKAENLIAKKEYRKKSRGLSNALKFLDKPKAE